MTRSSASRIDRRGTGDVKSVRSAAPNGTACHKMVRDVAVAMAHECYGALMARNDWYTLWKCENPGMNSDRLEKHWVNIHWGDFIEGARTTMAESLRQPMPDVLREQIADALILDKTLTRGRLSGLELMGAMRHENSR